MIFEFGTLSSILKAAHLNIIYMYHILKKSIRFTKLNLPIGTYIFLYKIPFYDDEFIPMWSNLGLLWFLYGPYLLLFSLFFSLSQSLSILGSYACNGLNLAINLNIVSHLARYKMTNVLGRLRFGHPWPLLTNVSHFEIRVGGTSNSIVSGKVTRSDIN